MQQILLLFLFAIAGLLQPVVAGSFPRVRIFNPKQGDIWFTGETRNIVWRKASIPPPPDPPTLNITLRRVNHTNVYPITIMYDTNTLTYAWRIPRWIPSGDDYRIYIIPNRAFPREGTPNIMASKSKPFSIVRSDPEGEITIKAPTAKDEWSGGQSRFIRWALPTITSPAKYSIFIADVKNGVVGKPYPYVIASALSVKLDGNGAAAYRWTVPYEFRTSDGYQIRVVAEFDDGTTAPIVAESALFKILQVGDAGQGTPTPAVAPPMPVETGL